MSKSSSIHKLPVKGLRSKEGLSNVFHLQRICQSSSIYKRHVKGPPFIKDLSKVFYHQTTCKWSSIIFIEKMPVKGLLPIEYPLKVFYP